MEEHEQRLTRSRSERLLGGVAGGLAAYLKIDPLIVRGIFLVLALINGIGALLYLGLWLLLPAQGSQAPDTRSQVNENLAEIREATQQVAAQVRGMFR